MQRQHGFTLLEVLVALLIVSIGLLGLAGLMTTGLKNNQSAWQTSQANWLAYDILDRMRANRNVALNGGYNYTGTPTGVAATDLNDWNQELGASLPAGTGTVLVTSGVARVTVTWDDTRGLGLLNLSGTTAGTHAGNSNRTLVIQSQL